MKKIIKCDDEIMSLDIKELEYFLNNNEQLSLEQLLLMWNKLLKMKFDEQSINIIKNRVEELLNKIDNLYELKRIQKKMYDLNLDTTYINKIKKKFLLKEINDPKSDISKIYNSIITGTKNREE